MNFIPADPMMGDQNGLMAPADMQNYGVHHGEVYVDPHMDAPHHIEGEYQEIHSLLIDGGDRFAVSAVAFDGQEELLWGGNGGGHATSYYGLGMQKYSSFHAHLSTEIRQLQSFDDKVLSLTADSLICHAKTGRKIFNFRDEHMADMQCMLLTSPTSVLLAGHHPRISLIDLETQTSMCDSEINEIGCAILRPSHSYICAGDTSGKVTLLDRDSLQPQHKLEAHSGTLSDFDVHGNHLITCGFASRMGSLTVDRFMMVYDLRFLRAMSPMQAPIEPMFLRFLPTYSDRICIVSQSGQFRLMELGAMTPGSMMMYQVQTDGSPITSFDVSSSYQAMAFGDASGYLHLFTTDESALFNAFSRETEFTPPTFHSENLTPISFTDELTPLSIIPMQYPTTGKLLSEWPMDALRRADRKPIPIDGEILRTMKVVQNVGYAPNPGATRRNQIPYKIKTSGKQRKANVPDSPLGRGEDPFLVIPKRYRRVEIKYSKLGVEDFDFRHYNKTNFAGLETHIPNAYCNAMLQVLYFIEPFRTAMLSHLCEKEFCLACELGFLFHMLDSQKGKTCQATNFLRAFRTIPEASALGLILGDAEESTGRVNLARLIQSWNRFILQQVHSELVDATREQEQVSSPPVVPIVLQPVPSPTPDSRHSDKESTEKTAESQEESTEDEPAKSTSEPPTPASPKSPIPAPLSPPIITPPPKETVITRICGSTLNNKFRCRCGQEMSRKVSSSLFDLIYPETKEATPVSFTTVVQNSLCVEQTTQAWCNKCDKYQPHTQTKFLQKLPDTLIFNCHLENPRDFEFWRQQEAFVSKVETEKTQAATKTIIKTCRYGAACTRKDCKFRHLTEADKGVSAAEPGLDMSRLSDDALEPGWLPLGLLIRHNDDGSLEVDTSDHDPEHVEEGWIHYELLANVAHVRDSKTGGNLVSQVKVGETFHQRKENVTCTQCYLFNDFSITPIEKQELVHFNLEWKVPCVLYYSRSDLLKRHNLTVTSPIGPEVLFKNGSLVTPRRRHQTFTPLDDEELPENRDVIGLDAEFVTLNQEEAELRSDGTRSTIKPSQMSVARITCIRGKGPMDGEPFIDDYISTSEQVVDYLTQFSGIKPGDLDASISSKHLTTLKTTYLKMRYLVDRGAIFVGHGLKKDFRVINLVVPKDQVIDTVELFYLPRQRLISLKYLAWFFLGINIQSVTHDSIEDARTALRLYKKYQEISSEGGDKIRKQLKDMYEKGRKMGWKIPESDPSSRTHTPVEH